MSQNCVICLETFKNNPRTIKDIREGKVQHKLSCGHDLFHRKCINDWLKKETKCPLCKKNVIIDQELMDFEDLNSNYDF